MAELLSGLVAHWCGHHHSIQDARPASSSTSRRAAGGWVIPPRTAIRGLVVGRKPVSTLAAAGPAVRSLAAIQGLVVRGGYVFYIDRTLEWPSPIHPGLACGRQPQA